MSTFAIFVDQYELTVSLLSYATPLDILKLELINSAFYRGIKRDILWKILFPRYFYSNSNPLDESIRWKINHPSSEKSVGWKVRVQQNDGLWKNGTIMDFRLGRIHGDEFLIMYDCARSEDEPNWEVEYRLHDRAHRYGVSRFEFLCPPENNQSLITETGVSAGQPAVFISSKNLQHVSWRREYEKMVNALPYRHAITFAVHTDEVLSVEFSHGGNKLAACSRDGTITVATLTARCTIESFVQVDTIEHHDACMLRWSPDDSFLVVATDGGRFHRGSIEIFSARLGYARILNVGCNPHSFLCPWMDEASLLMSHTVEFMSGRLLQEFLCLKSLDQRPSVQFRVRVLCTALNCVQLCELAMLASHDSGDSGSDSDSAVLPSGSGFPATAGRNTHLTKTLICCTGRVAAHVHILFLLPLTAETTASESSIDYRDLQSVDVNGAIIGIKVPQNGGINSFVTLNVRPASEPNAYAEEALRWRTMAGNADMLPVPNISSEAEVRLYSLPDLLHTHTFKGHHCFTLTQQPWFSFVDVQSRSQSSVLTTVDQRSLPACDERIDSSSNGADESSTTTACGVGSAITVGHSSGDGSRVASADADSDGVGYGGSDIGGGGCDSCVKARSPSPTALSQCHTAKEHPSQISETTGGGADFQSTDMVAPDEDDEFGDDLIASGAESGGVYIWSRRYGSDGPAKVFWGHTQHVGSVSFNPQVPGMLASGSDDGTVRVYVNLRSPPPSVSSCATGLQSLDSNGVVVYSKST